VIELMKRVERGPEKFRYVFSNKLSLVLEVNPREEFTLEMRTLSAGRYTTYSLPVDSSCGPSSHAPLFESSGVMSNRRGRAWRPSSRWTLMKSSQDQGGR